MKASTDQPLSRADVRALLRALVAGELAQETLEQYRVQLILAYQAGIQEAGDVLLRGDQRYISAKLNMLRLRGLEREELMQAARIGYLKAIAAWDPTKGAGLKTYGAYQIWAVAGRELVRHMSTIRLPDAVRGAIGRAFRGEEPMTPRLRRALRISRPLSMDVGWKPSGRGFLDDDLVQMHDWLPSDDETPEEAVIQSRRDAAVREAVERGLGWMSATERVVAEQLILADEPATLEAVGAQIGVGRGAVMRLRSKAAQKLRGSLHAAGFS